MTTAIIITVILYIGCLIYAEHKNKGEKNE